MYRDRDIDMLRYRFGKYRRKLDPVKFQRWKAVLALWWLNLWTLWVMVGLDAWACVYWNLGFSWLTAITQGVSNFHIWLVIVPRPQHLAEFVWRTKIWKLASDSLYLRQGSKRTCQEKYVPLFSSFIQPVRTGCLLVLYPDKENRMFTSELSQRCENAQTKTQLQMQSYRIIWKGTFLLP